MKMANVEDQYRNYPELKKSEVDKLVEWTKQQKHLPVIGELTACCFLHACKFSLEVSKQTYDLFCTTRTVIPEFFCNRDVLDKELIDIMETIAIYKVPKRTKEGHQVFICKLINTDSNRFSFASCIKLYSMCLELIQLEEGIADGIILVFDMQGATLGHLARVSLIQAKKFIFCLQDTLPIRLAYMHFINAVPFMDKVIALIRPFTKKHLLERLYIHTKMETFYEHIPKELVPIEYGGTVFSIDKEYNQLYENLKANREFFLEEERTGRTKEELREGRPKNASDVFGAEGNFKTLDID